MISSYSPFCPLLLIVKSNGLRCSQRKKIIPKLSPISGNYKEKNNVIGEGKKEKDTEFLAREKAEENKIEALVQTVCLSVHHKLWLI